MSMLDPLFTSTNVLLTSDYVSNFSTEKLLSKLGKVRKVTGIQFSKAKKTYAIVGTWDNVNAAFRLLKHWWDHPDDEPPGDFDFGENETIDQNDPAQVGLVSQQASTSLSQPNLVALHGYNDNAYLGKRLSDIDILKQAIEEGIGSRLWDHENITNRGKLQTNVSTIESRGKNNLKQDENIDEDGGKIENLADAGDKSNLNDLHNTKQKYKTYTCKRVVQDVNKVCDEENDNARQKTTKHLSQKKSNSKKHVTRAENQIEKSGKLLKVKKKTNEKSEIKGKVIDKGKTSKAGHESYKAGHESYKERTIDTEEKEGCVRETEPLHIEAAVLENRRNKKYWSRVKILDANEKHECLECNVVLKTRKRLNEHMKRIHIKGFTCKVCQRGFGYPTDLQRHKCTGATDPAGAKTKTGRPKKAKNTNPEFIPCQECEYIGSSKKRINEHIRRRHRLNFQCDTCDKAFGFVKDLQRHKENVHTEPAHFCDKCSRFYKSKTVFDLHMKTHEDGYIKPNYACQICGKSFTTKYVLAAHIKAEHLGMKKTYLCQICGKHFSQHNSYKQHLNAHAGIKPYVCDLCGKAFTYDKSLKEHKFMHDTVRRFQCPVCEKAFRQRTTLRIHMKVHQTVKDHNCQTCGRGFSQKQALERHERIHTGVKPYTCTYCQKAFGDSSTIRRHMLSVHHKSEGNWREDVISNVKKKTDYYVQGGSGHNRTYKTKQQSDNGVPKEQTTKKSHIIKKDTCKLEATPVQQLHVDLTEPQQQMEQTYAATSLPGQPDACVQPTNVFTIQHVPQHPPTVAVNYTIPPPHNQQEYVNIQHVQNSQENVENQVLVASFQQHLQQQPQQQQQHMADPVQAAQPVVTSATNLYQTPTLVTLSGAEAPRQEADSQIIPTSEALNGQLAGIWGFVGFPTYYNHTNVPQFQQGPQT